jgi:hypothetical protein
MATIEVKVMAEGRARKSSEIGSLFMEIDAETRRISAEFHMREYARLIDEVARRHKDSADLEIYALISISAIYTWLFSRTTEILAVDQIISNTVWIPVFIAFVVIIRRRSNHQISLKISSYISEIEEVYALRLDGGSGVYVDGWERRLWRNRASGPPFLKGISVTWSVVLAASIIIALIWRTHFPMTIQY